MLINVFNSKTTEIEKIESGKLDTKIHFNRNTRQEFTKKELEAFKTVKVEKVTKKK